MMKYVCSILVCMCVIACSEQGVVVGTDVDPTTLELGSAQFTIDGVKYKAQAGKASGKDNRDEAELEVLVIDGSRLFALELKNFSGIADYTITPSSGSVLFRYDDSGVSTYDSSEGSGRVSIKQYSSVRTAGTFEAVLISRTNSSDTLRITDGAFYVEF